VTLLANPESRLLGKEWIAKQMYHNMERMLERYHFPPEDSTEEYSTDEIVFDDDMDGSQGGYTFVQKRHMEGVGTFDHVVKYVKNTLLELQCSIPRYDSTLPKLVHEESQDCLMQSAFVTSGNEYVNVLVGQYESADRFVFVVQQIQEDAAITQSIEHCRQRNRMIWGEVRRLPGNRCRNRGLGLVSQLFSTRDGPLPLDEDAREWGFDLREYPEHLKEVWFPRLWREKMTREHARRKR
ncbi:hypothetical protein As57867_006279, partial [Aphanomyces stellatus]